MLLIKQRHHNIDNLLFAILKIFSQYIPVLANTDCLQNGLTGSTELFHLLVENFGKDHILVDNIAILAIVDYFNLNP